MAEDWFAGAEGREAEEQDFLDRLRERASEAPWSVSPLQTSAATWGVPIYLSVEIDSLSGLRKGHFPRDLEVAYFPASSASGRGLEGGWGDSRYPLDAQVAATGGPLEVWGIKAAPQQFADWAIEWFVAQLSRPLALQSWQRNATTVVLADVSKELGHTRAFWKRRGKPGNVRNLN